MTSEIDFCRNYVRAQDYDRYFLSLLAPHAAQPALWALLAFNCEIAKTREVVTETTIGLIRLQWWRDSLNAVYSGQEIARNDILSSVAHSIRAAHLPKEDFDHLIYAREFDLHDVLPASIEGLINYCDFTSTPLLRLIIKAMNVEINNIGIKNIATAYAIIGIIRAIPFHAQQHRCYMPADLMAKHGISAHMLYEMKTPENLHLIISDLCVAAEQYLAAGRAENKFIRGMHSLCLLYLGQIKKAAYNPFDKSLGRSPAFKQLRVFIGAAL